MIKTLTIQRAGLTDEQLIARAERAGWQWRERSNEWPGTEKYPATGWAESRDGDGPGTFHNCTVETKIECLRANTHPERPEKHPGFDHEHDCKICGKPIWLQWLGDKDKNLVELQECFGCNFWMNLVRKGDNIVIDHPRRNEYTISGRHHYQFGKATKPSSFNGFAGQRFVIRFFDGRIVETCDLWLQGKVPELFFDKLPVNAEMVRQ